MYRANRLKHKLKRGEKCLGGWLFMGSPVVTEALSLCGFDTLIIDQEHSPGSLETMNHQLRAASSTPTTMMVRVVNNELHYVKRALDAGAEGIMVANMESAEQAQSLVEYATFPIEGIRGVHRVSRAMDWGLAAGDYLKNIQDNLLTVGLIESVKGVEAIPEICTIPGIDMLFIGGVDLSASIGKAGQLNDPEVKELITAAEKQIVEGGKWLGRVIPPAANPHPYFEQGYDLVTNASDIVLLRDGALACVAQLDPKTSP